MDNIPLISVCIPTYNRDKFLDECLKSLTVQFHDKNVYRNTEIIIADNLSIDGTTKVVSKYQKKYRNIHYFKNKKNLSIGEGVIDVGRYARGRYIWYCSDDDVHIGDSLKYMSNVLKKKSPDVVYCNHQQCSKDLKKIVVKNSLGIKKDVYLQERKELYKFLAKKFIYTVDWFTSYYTNLVVSKKVYNLSYQLSKKYNSSLDVFPSSLAIYYTKNNYNIYIISKELIKYRRANASWTPEKKENMLVYWDKIYSNHYENIKNLNRDLPLEFLINLYIKNLVRKVRLTLLLKIKIDLRDFLNDPNN